MTENSTEARIEAAQALMQHLFAPVTTPVRGIEHAPVYRLGAHVGGDVADVFDCGSDGVFVSLADIEGSGHDAAVHAAMVKYGIRAYACAYRRPGEVLKNLDALYKRNCTSEGTESFASLFLGLIHGDRRSMTYVSAGYEAAMLVHGNGFCEVLPASGPVVGVLDDGQAEFAERTVQLTSGCMLVAVSDGVTDARFASRRFGLARIRHMLSERTTASLSSVVQEVIDAASAFCRGKLQTIWPYLQYDSRSMHK